MASILSLLSFSSSPAVSNKADEGMSPIVPITPPNSLKSVEELQHLCLTQSSHTVVPPEPYLVGIETNPGPPKIVFQTKKKKQKSKSRRKQGRTSDRYDHRSRVFNPLSAEPMPRISDFVPDMQIFKQSSSCALSPPSVTTSTITSTAQTYYFTMGALPQNTDLSVVFDQYRIDCAEIWVTPRQPNSNATNPGLIYSVVDYDDATSLSSASQAQEYANCIYSCGGTGHYRCLKPRMAVAAFSGAFSSYANMEPQWIDMASYDVQHYGVKLFFDQTSAALTYDVRCRLHYSLRATR
jgi:hypothetical protein